MNDRKWDAAQRSLDIQLPADEKDVDAMAVADLEAMTYQAIGCIQYECAMHGMDLGEAALEMLRMKYFGSQNEKKTALDLECEIVSEMESAVRRRIEKQIERGQR